MLLIVVVVTFFNHNFVNVIAGADIIDIVAGALRAAPALLECCPKLNQNRSNGSRDMAI